MGTALAVSKIEEMSVADIMSATGQADAMEAKLPYISLNKHSENDDGKPIPSGTFTFTKDAKQWFSPKDGKVKFRIFIRGYQYSVYDEDKNEYVNRSKIIKSWSEEAFDELGTVRCGKVKKTALPGLSPAQLEKQKKIACVQILYGVISGTFTSPSTGETQEVDQMPCIWRTSGTNFMSMGEFIDNLTKRKKPFVQIAIDIGLKREKNGDVVYYVSQPSADFTQPPQWDNDKDMPILSDFLNYLKTINDVVLEKYNSALKNKVNQNDVADEATLKVIDGKFKPLKADFPDDDIPF